MMDILPELWSVKLGKAAKDSNGGSISFMNVAPGTHDFFIGTLANYSLKRCYSGSLNVSASGESVLARAVELHRTLLTFRATFKEAGLPKHSSWHATFDGRTKTSTPSIITFIVPNGTYGFSAMTGAFETVNGSVSIDGSAAIEAVVFASEANPITVAREHGPPAPADWTRDFSATLARTFGQD